MLNKYFVIEESSERARAHPLLVFDDTVTLKGGTAQVGATKMCLLKHFDFAKIGLILGSDVLEKIYQA